MRKAMEERRMFRRVNAGWQVKFRILDKPAKKRRTDYKVGSAKDVSGSGVLLIDDKDLQPGNLVELELFAPTHSASLIFHHLLVVGEVVRVDQVKSKGLKAGVKFTHIDEKDRKKIIDYVEKGKGQ